MNRKLTFLTVFCFLFFAFPSCVSKKKFDEATKKASAEATKNAELNKRIAQKDESIRGLTKTNGDLNTKIAALNAAIKKLQDSVAALEESESNLEDKVAALTEKMGILHNESTKQLNSSKAQLAAQKQRLEQLQALIDQQQKVTEALRKKIADALSGFNSNEITVTMRNGKVYISMQESLLFPSGSADVNPKGKDALKKVATVVKTNNDINIDIEGHTDSLPIHNQKFADNWALSTARATSIAHVLIDEYKVSPTKLVASGRSQYDPVAPNGNPAGRAKNRRTEIILEPKLEELMNLLNK